MQKSSSSTDNIKIAVNGAKGRLGSHLVSMGCIPLEANILNTKDVADELEEINPDVVIHCAAKSNVDECELSYGLQLTRVNGVGVGMVRNIHKGRMIYISTDYVFDGKNGPYGEFAPTNPINSYGASKLFGEDVFREFDNPYDTIVRTTILYGNPNFQDFASSVITQLSSNDKFSLPVTLFGSPTYIPHLAEALIFIAHMKEPPKIVNIAGDGVVSRYEFGLMIANIFGYDPRQIVYTRSIPGVAHRPRRAGLKVDLAKKLKIPIYPIHEGIRSMKDRNEKKYDG